MSTENNHDESVKIDQLIYYELGTPDQDLINHPIVQIPITTITV